MNTGLKNVSRVCLVFSLCAFVYVCVCSVYICVVHVYVYAHAHIYEV